MDIKLLTSILASEAIEKKSCSRGYYYGVIESIINYWQPRKQNKKNLLQTETEEDNIKKKQNYDLTYALF